MAERQPDRVAIKVPRGRLPDGRIDYLSLSFRELDHEVDAWVGKLKERGVCSGDRVLMMVKQGLPLIAAAFALFKLGAVPVIIDPGMGRKNFLACVTRSKPRVLLGIPVAQLLSHVFRSAFASVEIRVWASSSAVARLAPSAQPSAFSAQPASSAATDLAAILFTSGSTGAPKGVCYEHGMFEAQVRLVRETYRIEPGEIDLPMLPIFALFNPALGVTTVVPEIDPRKPAAVDPEKIVRAIRQENITTSFGSPTLWRKIFDYCIAEGITLPGMRRVLCAGAAVPASLWADAARVLPNGKLHSPYGATEVLPVASTGSDEFESRPEFGALIGRVLPENQVKVIARQEGPIANLSEARALPDGEVGEIIVSGPTTTKRYDALPDATAATKIQAGNRVWHRMGDAGRFDANGRLWFSGRIAERIETAGGAVYTEPAEQVFRTHSQVVRCALIGLGVTGRQEPALVIQPRFATTDQTTLAKELRLLAQQYPHTAGLRKFFFHPDFPVDVRHNAKIHRLTLAKWAATVRAFEPDGAL